MRFKGFIPRTGSRAYLGKNLGIAISAVLFWVEKASAATPTSVSLDNPLKVNTAPELIGVIIQGALGVIGALVLLMFVWGGFQWLTSAGSPDKVKKGSQTMIWAGIGAVLVFSSYIILNAVLKAIRGEL